MTEERRPQHIDPEEPGIQRPEPVDPDDYPPGDLSIDPEYIRKKPRPEDIEWDSPDPKRPA